MVYSLLGSGCSVLYGLSADGSGQRFDGQKIKLCEWDVDINGEQNRLRGNRN